MELYREFFNLVKALNDAGVEYAVVGGIALAFHGRPRFTKDIDLLIGPGEIEKCRRVIESLGYRETTDPWDFKMTHVTLHRFGKKSSDEDADMMMIDLLVGHETRHQKVIQNSLVDHSASGDVKIAAKEDLIWMKKIRGSKQDEADIENLEGLL
ncbi:nucleotidyltransferase [Kamptonema cortianum]|nr:nucleotidyl transferase AbiEii/AbiGii toxin family protein [Oscillatoria laete-virens]MDK3160279.1 nucleotidyltransferase [Kamptonema cortianum]MDL5053664.1 nucleotidyltransferase [Oscillatoria laete-virens NRMC-F 0139]